ncbi:MAG: serine hydrolase domain-containing protein [Alphaproteobacteria bacterium]
MKRFLVALTLASLALVGWSAASAPAFAQPAAGRHIVDAAAVARINSTLQQMTSDGTIVGASALIFEHDREVYYGAFGYADREAHKPMARNTIVQIFSMTKPIVGVTLMTLYEQGKFNLDDPLSQYLPEYADVRVYAGVDASGQPILEAPHRPILVRDILRHTAGFANGKDDAGVGPLYATANPGDYNNTLTQLSQRLASVPLLYHPGEHWRYSNAVDIQARLVEVLSGEPFDRYVEEHVLRPLRMNETRYFVPPADRGRMAVIYDRVDDGTFTRRPDEQDYRFNFNHWPLTPGSFGFTSTLDNYMRFARMLQNGGELDGVRVLRRETVRLMSTNQLSDAITERWWLPSKGQVGFGIDFAVRLRPPQDADENNGQVGEFFWDGAASTLFWVDPVNDLEAVLFTQMMPFDKVHLHKRFRDAVYGPARLPPTAG